MVTDEFSAQKFRQLVAQVLQLDVDEVTESTSQHSVDSWDSLTHLSLCAALEETFQMQFTADEMTSIEDVRGLWSLVARRANGH